MKCVVAVFVVGGRVWGRCSVRVGCYVLQVDVDIACSREILRAFGGVNEAIAIESASQQLLSSNFFRIFSSFNCIRSARYVLLTTQLLQNEVRFHPC